MIPSNVSVTNLAQMIVCGNMVHIYLDSVHIRDATVGYNTLVLLENEYYILSSFQSVFYDSAGKSSGYVRTTNESVRLYTASSGDLEFPYLGIFFMIDPTRSR